jgi:phospholipid/cholesterol/gamma-HCH transport system permease protein
VSPAARRSLAASLWHRLAAGWPALSVASVAASLALAPRPLTWRRPVRDEFWRFAAIAGPGSLVAIAGAAVLIGAGLIGQGVYWLEQVGQPAAVARTLLVILIREITPVVVGLVSLGRAGLANLAELDAMRTNGTIRTLEAHGLDPFMLFVLPRILALGICTLAHAVVFLVVAVLAGHAFANLLGVATQDVFGVARRTSRVLGEVGYLVLPLKTLLIGFAIAAVTAVTVLKPPRGGTTMLLASGFFRTLVAIVVVSLVGSLLL